MSEQPVSLVGQVLVTPDANGFGDYIFLEELSLQIYYWPESAIKAGPTAEELRECTSRTQREELLNPWFNIGQKVRFEVCNERRGIATKVRKYGNVTHEYGIYPGVDEHVVSVLAQYFEAPRVVCKSRLFATVASSTLVQDDLRSIRRWRKAVLFDASQGRHRRSSLRRWSDAVRSVQRIRRNRRRQRLSAMQFPFAQLRR